VADKKEHIVLRRICVFSVEKPPFRTLHQIITSNVCNKKIWNFRKNVSIFAASYSNILSKGRLIYREEGRD